MQTKLLDAISKAESLYKVATESLEMLVRERLKHSGEIRPEQTTEFSRAKRQLEAELQRLHCPQLPEMPAVEYVSLWRIGPVTVGVQEDTLDVLEVAILTFPPEEILESLAASRDHFLEWFASLRMLAGSESTAAEFVGTPLQKAIWDALEGRHLTVQKLADVVCGGDHTRLYKPNGLKELKGEGRVVLKRGVGYYRPDAPPQSETLRNKLATN